MYGAKGFRILSSLRVFICALLVIGAPSKAQNKVMGEIEFVGATQVEKHSGIWVDGQYVGYLDELKGDRKVLLLPGEHEIVVRESGYKDFTQKVLVEPGQKQAISIKLENDPRVRLPSVTADVKLDVTPSRAAVFMAGGDVGAGHDLGGPVRAFVD